MNKYVTEFIGTFFLVLTMGLTINPIAIGFMLAALVYMGGHISGAHYNPAVSLAVYMRRRLTSKDLFMYWVFQILGATLAAIIYFVLLGKTLAPSPLEGFGFFKAILVEFIFTFALLLVILNVATTKATSGNSYFGLAIGITVMGAAFAAGPLSGGALNPAVGIGPTIVDTINGGDSMQDVLIYIIGPFAGGAAGSVVYKFMNPVEYKDESLTYHE